MSLTSIAKLAEDSFINTLNSVYDDYPELIIKYPLDKNMKNEFIEAVLRQVWNQKEYDLEEILKFTLIRFNTRKET